MKNLKYLIFLLLVTNAFSLEILIPKAPPAIPAIKAAETIGNINLNYYTDTVTEAVPKIMQNKPYIYVVPTNLAAKLNTNGKDLQLLGIISSGMLSIISKEEKSDISLLNGKEIFVGGQGSSPDVITQYILKKNSITAELKYRTSPEVAKLIMSNKADFAVLPEPLATMALFQNKALKRTFILKNEWEKLNNGQGIPQVGFFASKKLIAENTQEIAEFLDSYKKAVTWVNENNEEAAILGKNNLMLPMSAKVIENSIPNMNLIYTDSLESKAAVISYLENLKEISEKIISNLPKDDFYEK